MGAVNGALVEGNLALDLVNTEEFRRGVRRDFIELESDFVMWLSSEELAGALSKVQIPFQVEVWSSENLEKVRKLRSELRRHFVAIAAEKKISTDFVHKMESFVEKAPLKMKIHDERVIYVPIGNPIERFRSLVAMNVLQLLGEGKLLHLKHCGNPACLFMFIDTSGKRKWCSMKRCGNRAKVTKHLSKKFSRTSI